MTESPFGDFYVESGDCLLGSIKLGAWLHLLATVSGKHETVQFAVPVHVHTYIRPCFKGTNTDMRSILRSM